MESENLQKKRKLNETDKTRFKILCIHGYRQNGVLFRQKTGALRKFLKKYADLSYATAPLNVPLLEGSSDSNTDQRGWWFTNSNMNYDSKSYSECCIGFKKSLDLITDLCEEEGPFDGILGFSQGASFVSVLCGMQERKFLKFKFKFAILISGFRSLSTPHYKNYIMKIKIPSLHIYGETDEVIPTGMSEQLLGYFTKPIAVKHPGGHYVPSSESVRKAFVQFLEEGIYEENLDEESGLSDFSESVSDNESD